MYIKRAMHSLKPRWWRGSHGRAVAGIEYANLHDRRLGDRFPRPLRHPSPSIGGYEMKDKRGGLVLEEVDFVRVSRPDSLLLHKLTGTTPPPRPIDSVFFLELVTPTTVVTNSGSGGGLGVGQITDNVYHARIN